MHIKYTKQLSIVTLFLVILTCLCYVFSSELLPFILSFIFAYFLLPIVNLAESKFGIRRSYVSLIVIVLFIAVGFIIVSSFLPILFIQVKSLIKTFDGYNFAYYKQKFYHVFGWLELHYPDIYVKINDKIGSASNFLFKLMGQVFSNILYSTNMLMSITAMALFIPLITFYILQEMPKIKNILKGLIPISLKSDIIGLINDINKTIGNYFRGQLLVCFILGIYYSIAFYLIGIKYPIALGMMTGILIFIPYFGISISLILVLLLTWLEFESIKILLYIAAIFLAGQVAEGAFITPRLLGKSVNLHPVWIIFGVFFGGGLFGFLGILLAIPLTAVAGVLIRFLVKKYKNSNLYKY